MYFGKYSRLYKIARFFTNCLLIPPVNYSLIENLPANRQFAAPIALQISKVLRFFTLFIQFLDLFSRGQFALADLSR